jgi:hypothetical protein
LKDAAGSTMGAFKKYNKICKSTINKFSPLNKNTDLK